MVDLPSGLPALEEVGLEGNLRPVQVTGCHRILHRLHPRATEVPEGEELTYHEDLNLYWYEVDPENYIEYYNYQIDYLNRKLLNTIDQILVNSKRPLVIIIQSDHGDERYLDRDAPTKKGINVRSGILNAIYYSDQDSYL